MQGGVVEDQGCSLTRNDNFPTTLTPPFLGNLGTELPAWVPPSHLNLYTHRQTGFRQTVGNMTFPIRQALPSPLGRRRLPKLSQREARAGQGHEIGLNLVLGGGGTVVRAWGRHASLQAGSETFSQSLGSDRDSGGTVVEQVWA